MADTDPQDNENTETPDLVLSEVAEIAPDDLSDDQKTFLEDNKAELSDEQLEKYGLEKATKEEPPEDVEPETRTPAEKAKAKTKEDEAEGDEDEEINPDDEKTITKVVDKRVDSLARELAATKDQVEVDSFIRANPEYEKYRGSMLKFIGHPAYRNIPVNNIAAIVASKDQQKIGAAKEREADKKAKDTQAGGSNARKQEGGKVDWSTASKEDLEAQKAKVFGREGV